MSAPTVLFTSLPFLHLWLRRRLPTIRHSTAIFWKRPLRWKPLPKYNLNSVSVEVWACGPWRRTEHARVGLRMKSLMFLLVWLVFFTMVACLFSLLLLIMLMVPCFSRVGGTAYMQKLGQLLMLLGFLHSLSFIILKADICTSVIVCELDSTGFVSIAASVMWIVASCLALLVRAKPVERKSTIRRASRTPTNDTREGSLQGGSNKESADEVDSAIDP